MPSLRIRMSSQSSSTYIDCWCTKWDETDYSVVIETFLDSSNRNTLFSNIRPGIYKQLHDINWQPWYLDISIPPKSNTLYLEPLYGFGLSSLRTGREVVVKNVSDTIITPNYFNVKIECLRVLSPT